MWGFGADSLPSTVEVVQGLVSPTDAVYDSDIAPLYMSKFVYASDGILPDNRGLIGKLVPDSSTNIMHESGGAVMLARADRGSRIVLTDEDSVIVTGSAGLVAEMVNPAAWAGWAVVLGDDQQLQAARAIIKATPSPAPVPATAPVPAPVPTPAPALVAKGKLGLVGWSVIGGIGVVGLAYLFTRKGSR